MSGRRGRHASVVVLVSVWLLLPRPAAGADGRPAETLRVPVFGTVTIYAPATAPTQVVLFLSGDGGWNLGVVPMAERLREEGALVVGIDIRALMKSLEASSSCAYPAGALEELSRAVQARAKLAAYLRPILVGYSSGATMAYAAIAAAPPETFAGAVSLGFCPDLELRAPLCQMRGLRATKRPKGIGVDLAPYRESSVPWMVLQGEVDQVCDPAGTRAFVAATGGARLFWLPKVGHGFGVTARWEPAYLEAYHALASQAAPRKASSASTAPVADLSLTEVPATGARISDTLAVVLSGDGGWAEIDKQIAAGLSSAGIPVVGWSSLDYYWSPRTPERASADLARIVDHYTVAWKRPRVIVVGYSFGADVAPFLVNRLPPSARARLRRVALLGPSAHATFEFHFSDWMGGGEDVRYPTHPEIGRLNVPTLCLSSDDEAKAACAASSNPLVRSATVGAGHHFSGQYARLVELITGN
jgi:type IV secretory pathway VirJ component